MWVEWELVLIMLCSSRAHAILPHILFLTCLVPENHQIGCFLWLVAMFGPIKNFRNTEVFGPGRRKAGWHPFALPSHSLLWRPFALNSFCCDFPLLWHPLLWHPSAVKFQNPKIRSPEVRLLSLLWLLFHLFDDVLWFMYRCSFAIFIFVIVTCSYLTM